MSVVRLRRQWLPIPAPADTMPRPADTHQSPNHGNEKELTAPAVFIILCSEPACAGRAHTYHSYPGWDRSSAKPAPVCSPQHPQQSAALVPENGIGVQHGTWRSFSRSFSSLSRSAASLRPSTRAWLLSSSALNHLLYAFSDVDCFCCMLTCRWSASSKHQPCSARCAGRPFQSY